MSAFLAALNDRCLIQSRTVDTTGKEDLEAFNAQPKPVKCRVIKIPNRRKTSPDNAEKVQYGTFIFTNIILPKNTEISIHDRIVHPVKNGRTYDVLEVNESRDGRGPSHLVAICDVRA